MNIEKVSLELYEGRGEGVHSFYREIKGRGAPAFYEVEILSFLRSDYARGYEGYRPYFSEDGGAHWKRTLPMVLVDGRLVFSFESDASWLLLAWYPPQDFDLLLSKWSKVFGEKIKIEREHGFAVLEQNPEDPYGVIVCGQHPGEHMAYHFLEGVVQSIAANFAGNFIIFFDFSCSCRAGFTHRFVDGVDLNRSWVPFSGVSQIEKAMAIMDACPVFFVLDIHGDEVSKISYARSTDDSFFQELSFLESEFFCFFKKRPAWKQFVANCLKGRFRRRNTLLRYAEGKKIPSALFEISAWAHDPEEARALGVRLEFPIRLR